MERSDIDRAQLVAEDLEYLRHTWDHEIDDASLRRSSAILRKLLVENDFGKAWRSLGLEKQPLIAAVELRSITQGTPHRDVVFAHAGGASYHGMVVYGVMVQHRALSPREARERSKNADPGERLFSLSKFVEAPVMIVRGTCINRREIILYVVNKCGGAHFDPKRDGGKPLGKKFALLDMVRNEQMQVADKEAVYLSLLAIGQNLANAADTEVYLGRWKAIRGS